MADGQTAKRGRRTKCTPELTELLCELLQAGNFIGVACSAVGISKATYHGWSQRAREELERLELPGARPRQREQIYLDFLDRCARAIAKAETDAVEVIRAAMKRKNVNAAIFYLERAHGDRWGKRRLELEIKNVPQVHIFMPEEDG